MDEDDTSFVCTESSSEDEKGRKFHSHLGNINVSLPKGSKYKNTTMDRHFDKKTRKRCFQTKSQKMDLSVTRSSSKLSPSLKR